MTKIIWFKNTNENLFPSFVVAEQITDATVMHCFNGNEEDGAELSIGLCGSGSRWKAYNFNTHNAADEALNSIAEIILDKRSGEYSISIKDGTWRFVEDE